MIYKPFLRSPFARVMVSRPLRTSPAGELGHLKDVLLLRVSPTQSP